MYDRTRRQLMVGSAALIAASCAGCADDRTGDPAPSASPVDDSTETPSKRPTTGTPTATSTTGTSTETATATETETETATAETTSTATPAPQDATFETADGQPLVGTLYGTGPCGVVLVPQANRDRKSWEPQASWLAEAGYLAFAIDEGKNRADGVEAAVRYLREGRELETVALIGASTGGEAVVTAAARRDASVDGVVALSAAGGGEYAAALSGEKLFVVAREDDDRFVETARRLHEAATEPKELLVYDGSAHGQGLFESSHRDDLRRRIGQLLRAVCAPSNP